MGKRNVPGLVAAAQQAVNSGLSVKAACRQHGIGVSTFYAHGGSSTRGAAATDIDDARALAREMLRQSADTFWGSENITAEPDNDEPVIELVVDEKGNETVRFCGMDTDLDALTFGVTCIVVANIDDGHESLLVSRKGMAAFMQESDGWVKVQYYDMAEDSTAELVGWMGDADIEGMLKSVNKH